LVSKVVVDGGGIGFGDEKKNPINQTNGILLGGEGGERVHFCGDKVIEKQGVAKVVFYSGS